MGLSFFPRCHRSGCIPIVVGVCVGIVLSVMLTPLIDEDCKMSADHYAGVRSLQSEAIGAGAAGEAAGDADDYEPRLNLEGKAKIQGNAGPPPKKPSSRPRFYSSELGIKDKLFVAVITDVDRIAHSGVAINSTLSHYADKLVFFMRTSGGTEGQVPATMPTVVGFANGPEKFRPFHAINYIGYHHINDYDFFFLMMDDLYVRGPALGTLVNGISVSRNVFMGQPAESAAESDSAGGPACDFSGGILFSQGVLKSIIANINWCQQNADSEDASTNINRCVWHAAKVACQRSVQGHSFSSFVLSDSFNAQSDIENLKDREQFADALTFRPVTSAATFYRLHLHFSRVELERTHRDIVALQSNILTTNEFLPAQFRIQSWPIGLSPPIKTDDRFSVLSWNYVTTTRIFPDGDFRSGRNLTSLERHDLLEVIDAAAVHLTQKNRPERKLRLDSLLNGYTRFDPTRGMEYLLDLLMLDDTESSDTRLVKRVGAVRALGKVELVPMPYVTENTRLVMILPVGPGATSRREAETFLRDFARECLERQDNVLLIMIFLHGQAGDEFDDGQAPNVASLRNLIGEYNSRYQTEGAKVSWVEIKNADRPPRLFGVIDVLSRRFPADTLFIVCHPGMEIHIEFLNRARMNTIAGYQVFFPIPFKQYQPDIIYSEKPYPATVEINKNNGAFDDHEFDFFSFFNSDYIKGRKLIEEEVPVAKSDRDIKDVRHHGKNGHDVYNMFLKMRSVHVMRAVDPSLRIRFQTKSCSSLANDVTKNQCLASRSIGLASRAQLASLLFDYQKYQLSENPDRN